MLVGGHWAIPCLVLVLGLWRPRLGLLLLVAALPFFGSPPAGPYLGALDAAGVAAILIGVRERIAKRREREGTGTVPWPIAAWVVVSMVSLVPLTYHPPSWRPGLLVGLVEALPHAEAESLLYSWRAFQELLVGVGLYWSFRTVFEGRSIRPVALAMASGLAITVIAGGAELAGIDIGFYRAIGGPLFEGRLHSLFFHSGWMAQYLIVGAPFAIAGLSLGTRWQKRAAVVLALAVLLMVVLSQQRGAQLALLLQLLLLGWLIRRWNAGVGRRALVAVALVAAAVGALLVLGWFRPYVFDLLAERWSDDLLALSGRRTVWSRSFSLWLHEPLSGIGLGSFGRIYRDLYDAGPWATAHNLYLHTLVERGILGLAALCLLGAVAIRRLRAGFDANAREIRRLALGLLASLLGLAVYGGVQYIFYLEMIEWLCWILFAAIVTLDPASSSSKSTRVLAIGILTAAIVSVPWRLAPIAELRAPEAPRQASFGFHLPERTREGVDFRWTTGHAAQRFPWSGETLVVRLANGHPRAGEHPVEVTLEVDGEQLWRGSPGGAWQEIALEVGPPTKESIVLEIHVRPTFRPFQEQQEHPETASSHDIRELGVAVSRLAWR